MYKIGTWSQANSTKGHMYVMSERKCPRENEHGVARFLLVQNTQTGKNDRKIANWP
jgi:hypothetical protein